MNKSVRQFIKLTVWLNVTLFIFTLSTTHSDMGFAQEQCGTADSITYPIDINQFQIAQDFGVASPRHQGRFHTGEDWHLVGTPNTGYPVRAIATGRVTYSSANGWGRDGGVIIIEHTFPNGTIIYSQYGHITENDNTTFPARFSCVQGGDVIAVIGSARPAPHVHFEIRTNQPDIPGPGYTRENPLELGWVRPMQFVTNQQAWLSSAHQWHVMNDIFSPILQPLVLNDNSMMVINGDLLRGVTNDGRILWRRQNPETAVSVTGFQANPYITYANGQISQLDFEGVVVTTWSLDFAPDSPPIPLNNGDTLIYHTADNALVALTADRRDIAWRLDDIPPILRWQIAGAIIGLVTDDNRILFVSHGGELLDEADLRDGASMATAPNGDLIVYTQGGLWFVDDTATWSLVFPDISIPPGGSHSAVAQTLDGTVYVTDGITFHAYDAQGLLLWEVTLPQRVTGKMSLTSYNGGLLLTSNHGNIMMIRASGGICGFMRIYGNNFANVWHDLGTDNILRVAIGDQIIGLDWERFAGSCAG